MVRELSTEKRKKFLSAALALFVSKGVQNATTAEIAKAAGAATGTLFLYFPTKQDLINALVLTITQEQSTYIKSLLDPALSVHDTFFTVWNGSVRWFLDNPQAYQYSQQIRDFGPCFGGGRPGNRKILQFLLRNHSKGSGRRAHQVLSGRSNRRLPLSGNRRCDELPAPAAGPRRTGAIHPTGFRTLLGWDQQQVSVKFTFF